MILEATEAERSPHFDASAKRHSPAWPALPIAPVQQLSLLDPEPRGPCRGEGLPARAWRLLQVVRFRAGGPGGDLRSRLEEIRAIARLEEAGDAERCALFALGLHALERGEWREASRRFETLQADGLRPADRGWTWLLRAEAELADGPPDRCVRACARAAREAFRSGDARLRARAHLLAARSAASRGDGVRARRALDRLADRRDHGSLRIAARLVEADLLRSEGRHSAAEAACSEAFDAATRERPPVRPDRWFAPAAILRRWAEILLDQDRHAEAAERIRQVAELAGEAECGERGRLLLLEARLHLERGEEEVAARRIEEAEQILRSGNRTAALADALLLRGETVGLASPDPSERCAAREAVFEARALYRRLGRDREVACCERWLEALRVRAPEGEAARIGRRDLPRVPRSRRLSRLGFVTADPRILQAIAPLESLARTRIPVLILGESGTGKEVLARALHRAGGGRGPFLAVNCGALPAELQESELFGHARGSFTGAVAEKAGLFEAADGGTLLLDEVGEMSPGAQVKLLRTLELGEVRRVGETRTRTVKVRVIAATNADLKREIRAGRFRADLYYRLGGLEVTLPPLRERLGDVPLLAAHFARLFTCDGPRGPELAPEALDLLLRHAWPGNVRELRFCIEKASALTGALQRMRIEADCIDLDPIEPEPPPEHEAAPEEDQIRAIGLDAYVENIERRLILRALEENGWNRTRAARSLGGVSRTTLIGKMKRLGLFPGPERQEDEEQDEERAEED